MLGISWSYQIKAFVFKIVSKSQFVVIKLSASSGICNYDNFINLMEIDMREDR